MWASSGGSLVKSCSSARNFGSVGGGPSLMVVARIDDGGVRFVEEIVI